MFGSTRLSLVSLDHVYCNERGHTACNALDCSCIIHTKIHIEKLLSAYKETFNLKLDSHITQVSGDQINPHHSMIISVGLLRMHGISYLPHVAHVLLLFSLCLLFFFVFCVA